MSKWGEIGRNPLPAAAVRRSNWAIRTERSERRVFQKGKFGPRLRGRRERPERGVNSERKLSRMLTHLFIRRVDGRVVGASEKSPRRSVVRCRQYTFSRCGERSCRRASGPCMSECPRRREVQAPRSLSPFGRFRALPPRIYASALLFTNIFLEDGMMQGTPAPDISV